VFVGLFVVGVNGLKALFGEDESSATDNTDGPLDASTTSSGAVAVDPSAGVVITPAPSGDIAAGGTTTTVTTVPDTGTIPTPADPARVLLLGDSEAGGLAPFLGRVLDDTGITDLTVDYKVSSGLVRPDFFDWPARLRSTVPAANPDIVVVLFGGNDGQGFPNTTNQVDSPEWRAEYARRVAEVVEILAADGRTLIWVGVPNAESENLTAKLKVQNEVVTAELVNHPEVIFVDAWNRFTGIDGGFAPYVADPRDGVFKPVRSQTDGFHLNTTGEEILAFDVGSAIINELKARGATL
jgi:hypothetical protein